MNAQMRTEREQFIKHMIEEFGENAERVATLLLRHAKTYQRLETDSCNGHPAQGSPHLEASVINKLQDQWDRRIAYREEQLEKRMTALGQSIGCKVTFDGDPRGYTVRVWFPSGRYNTWGGKESGYGVPSA